MTEFLYGLFFLGVLALVVGCFAYLFGIRPRRAGEVAPPSRAAVKRAEGLSGAYRLSELESILEQFGAIEAWGMVLELKFTTVREEIQMIVNRNEVELCAPSLDPGDTDLFRRAATEAGLQARTGYTEGQYCVDVMGTWPKIAGIIRGISRTIYGVAESEEVEVRIFT